MTVNVLIVARFQKEWVERLQRLSSEVHVTLHPVQERGQRVPAALWQETEVAYTYSNHLPSPEHASRLRWAQLYSAGAERLLEDPLFKTDILFTTMSGIHATPIGEYVLTTVLAWFHRLPLLLDWQHQQNWQRNSSLKAEFLPQEIRGKTLGVVGYGSIGREVARLAKAFGMRIVAMQRGNDHRDTGFVFPDTGDPEGSLPERYYQPEQLHAMLQVCDVVVIGVPLTKQTYHMFDRAAFGAMKPGAFLVNIARGDVCDEDALIQALADRQIAGAALDVFHKEPLPTDSPLWKMPNVLISPHITGLSEHYDERGAQVFEANLRRYLKGEPLYNLVNKERGY